MEIWKDIEGYEGLYQVSNMGNIKSLRTNKNCYLSNSKIYKRVLLSKNGKAKGYSVHRLVAQAFIPNPNNYPCVNHLDYNGSNNKASNLEWCTYAENNNYRNHHLKRYLSLSIKAMKENHPNRKDLITKLMEVKKEIEHL